VMIGCNPVDFDPLGARGRPNGDRIEAQGF